MIGICQEVDLVDKEDEKQGWDRLISRPNSVIKQEFIVSREDFNEHWAFLHVIDVDSGLELYNRWVPKTFTGKIRLSKPKKANSGTYTGGKRPFAKVYTDVWEEVLTTPEYGTLPERKNQVFLMIFLCCYADRKTGRIHRKRANSKGEDFLSQQMIAEKTGLSTATVSRTINLLLKNQLLTEDGGYYYLGKKFTKRG